MDNQPNNVDGDLENTFSTGWIDLSARVRARLSRLQPVANGSPYEEDFAALERDATKLCDHLERIHRDAAKYLEEADHDSAPSPKPDGSPSIYKDTQPEEFGKEAITIEREAHEHQGSFKEIIKALFLWQDHPDERLSEKSKG